jgi:hypothetical protein
MDRNLEKIKAIIASRITKKKKNKEQEEEEEEERRKKKRKEKNWAKNSSPYFLFLSFLFLFNMCENGYV